ncbi:MAG: ATP-binding protein [Muribaculaceae bacterium]|nr:ATP-binding protein [Muribaculaceae bacterium]
MFQSKEIKYPVGIQTFSVVREGGYLYVDKTAFIARLLRGKYYFLSRPRRFGKSLFLSTLESYFLGERELFKGLAIENLTEKWEKYPVLHLDLNNRQYVSLESLKEELISHLEQWEAIYGDEKQDRAVEERFAYVIRRAKELTGKDVVILVDEYDKPLLSSIAHPDLSAQYRDLLKAFYSNLKSMDRYIKFAMLTGVARFSKVSIFSDLNNLNDITFVDDFAGICGITAEELNHYFDKSTDYLAQSLGSTPEKIKEDLKRRYDGYHFTEKSPDIYNPFSIMKVFDNKRMDSYWFESGTPSYLVKLIEQGGWKLRNLAPTEIEETKLATADIMTQNPILVCFQSGYLTIKGYDPVFKTYLLDYPNEEVKEGFLSFLVPYYIQKEGKDGVFSVKRFTMAILKGDIEEFMNLLSSMISGVPYSEKGSAEAHFQNATYLLFTLMGFYTNTEVRTSDGRIDLKLETPRFVYIFEFKIDSSAEEAMSQIEKKEYWVPYLNNGKEIVLIGADFSTKTRRITDWIIKSI